MGLRKWLRRKIDEFDEKQRKEAEERKYYEHERREARARELEKIQIRREVEARDRQRREFWNDPLGIKRSDD